MPNDVFIVPSVDQSVYLACRIVAKENSSLDAFAEEDVACFRV
jgi:hypothetical protein